MPTVGIRGQAGFKEFDYTPKGIADAKEYAKETGLTLHSEKAASGAPQRAARIKKSPPRATSGRVNVPKPSTVRY
jgi:hypothetical protein